MTKSIQQAKTLLKEELVFLILNYKLSMMVNQDAFLEYIRNGYDV